LIGVAVKVTEVPEQIDPEGLAEIDTEVLAVPCTLIKLVFVFVVEPDAFPEVSEIVFNPDVVYCTVTGPEEVEVAGEAPEPKFQE
jgi:hypothetical protein